MVWKMDKYKVEPSHIENKKSNKCKCCLPNAPNWCEHVKEFQEGKDSAVPHYCVSSRLRQSHERSGSRNHFRASSKLDTVHTIVGKGILTRCWCFIITCFLGWMISKIFCCPASKVTVAQLWLPNEVSSNMGPILWVFFRLWRLLAFEICHPMSDFLILC